MSEYFDPSPRSSKRRKISTYSIDSSATADQSSKAPPVLRAVSETFSGLSRRLFEPKKPMRSPAVTNDSTYGSKEDSLVEDDADEATKDTDTTASKGNEHEPQKELQVLRSSSTFETPAKGTSHTSSTEQVSVSERSAPSAGSARSTRSKKAEQIEEREKRKEQSSPATGTLPKHELDSTKRTSQTRQSSGKQDKEKSATSERRTLKRPAPASEYKSPVASRLPRNTAGTYRANEQNGSDRENTGDNEDTIIIRTRSSGRDRRPTKRVLSLSSTADSAKTNPLKGILSPAREKSADILTLLRNEKRGLRKSVVFDDQEKWIGEELGFKDVDHSTTKSKHEKQKGSNESLENRAEPAPTTALQPSETDVGAVDPDEPRFENEILPDDLSLVELREGVLPVDAVSEDVLDDPYVTEIKSTILSRLTSRTTTRSNLLHLQTQFATLHTLLSSTITAGESNSILLLGSRGSGKSLLVNTALTDLTQQHADDFHVVRLSGFIQTDDKLALREIWRQLGREMRVDEDETNEVSSYADTMASLLGLLAHPEERLDPNVMSLDGTRDARTAKSVVFILDEFELFTTHPRQTLLYNLFDIAQARKAPIAVIGCSARMDVVDCLEKRVKSRFSHRWVHVPSPKSLSGWEDVVAATLCMNKQEQDANRVLSGNDDSNVQQREWTRRWDEYIKTSFLPSTTIQSLLKDTFYTTKSLPDLFAALHIPIATLVISSEPITAKHSQPLITTTTTTAPSPILALLPSLPLLHLNLLVCATRLESIHSLSLLNFNITYAHYTELCARSKLQQNAVGFRLWSRAVARGAWEELAAWELLIAVEASSATGGKADVVGTETRMWRVDVGIEEVGWAVSRKAREGGGAGGMTEVLGKWCREI